MATEVELAWAAGLFDGEGCIQINKTRPRGRHASTLYTLCTNLNMTDLPTVEEFHRIVNCGSIQHRLKGKYKTLHCWTATTRLARRVLLFLMPYLRYKQPQALVAIDYQNTIAPNGGPKLTQAELRRRNEYYLKLQEMKK